jgi:hypothetical protein
LGGPPVSRSSQLNDVSEFVGKYRIDCPRSELGNLAI